MEYEHTVQTPARRSMIRTVTTVNFNLLGGWLKELSTSPSSTSSSSLSTLQVIVTTRSRLRGTRTRSLAPVRMRSRVIFNLKRRNTRQLTTLQTQAHYLMSTVGNTSSKVEPRLMDASAEFPRGPVPSPYLERLCPSVVGVLISL